MLKNFSPLCCCKSHEDRNGEYIYIYIFFFFWGGGVRGSETVINIPNCLMGQVLEL